MSRIGRGTWRAARRLRMLRESCGWLVLCACSLLAATPARADVWADLAADQRAVVAARRRAPRRRDAPGGARARQATRWPAQIERVKAERRRAPRRAAAGAPRRAEAAKSDELERLAVRRCAAAPRCSPARARKLIADCDRALAAPKLAEARGLELARLRTAQAAALAAPAAPLGVARAADDPLDGPRELQDKADLLRDSGDKLRREVQRLAHAHRRRRAAAPPARARRRRRRGSLRRSRSPTAARRAWRRRRFGSNRGGAADSQRRQPPTTGAGARQPAAAPAARAARPAAAPARPRPAAAAPAAATAARGGVRRRRHRRRHQRRRHSAPPRGGDTTVLRNLVDPATLDELRRSDGGDDLERQLRALRRAQGELNGLATELDRRARALSQRADELKHKK